MGDNARVASDRGHLKVFIGMAPGVGKTYRMLQEGHAELENGRDVVVGIREREHQRGRGVRPEAGQHLRPFVGA